MADCLTYQIFMVLIQDRTKCCNYGQNAHRLHILCIGRGRSIERIIGIVVLFVAFGAIVCAGYSFLKSQDTRNWPSVEGMVTKSSTRTQREPGASGTPTTIADVWYKFVIDGVEYHNDTISLAQYGSSSASHAVKEARRYPVGSKVIVYYNPENFHESILEHKTPWIFIGLFAGLGSILIYIGVGLLSGSFKTNHYAAARRSNNYQSYDARKAPIRKHLNRLLGYKNFFNGMM